MSQLWRARKFLKHLIVAQNRHGVHSPFVYKLLDEVIYDRAKYQEYKVIEDLRARLLSRQDRIAVTDLGAGSSIDRSKHRRVADIANSSAKSGKWGRLLFRLCRHFRPDNMLELGTSLGIGSLYQSLGHPTGKLVTLEGCPNTANIAREQFAQTTINATIVEGNFDDTLALTLSQSEKLDWVFIDGNHRKEPTLRYFHQCLEKCHSNSTLVFDDIHWSRDMAEAWRLIKQHDRVTVTLDLFQLGIVFLRTEQRKQHFTIRY